eukprot:Skav230167  [mRNA]  locus=scaffold996:186082:190311:- [translate_table: standard]
MEGLYPWLVLAAAMHLRLSYIIYHHFVDPEKSYFLAMVTVILSLTVGILCTLIIPASWLKEGTWFSPDHVRDAYLVLFSSLLFIAVLTHSQLTEGSECNHRHRSNPFHSLHEVVALLIISLNFRPGHKESLDRALQSEESAAMYTAYGLAAMPFDWLRLGPL